MYNLKKKSGIIVKHVNNSQNFFNQFLFIDDTVAV